MSYDAIVIGGGVLGLSIAYHLVEAGARALLLDRADRGRATDAGAGILTAETNGYASDAWLDFAAAAVAYYPPLVEQLRAAGASATGYARCGQLVVAVDEDELASFERAHAWMLAQQRRRGSPAPEDLREIRPEEAQKLFPPLGPVRRALYYRNAARVDGRMLAQALREAAIARGLVLQQASAERLLIADSTAQGVVAGGSRYLAASVVIAGGAWSAQFAEQLGLHIPIAPLRGQILHLGLAGAASASWPLITAFHGHYLVAWPDSRVVAGATQEPEAGFQTNTTASGLQELLHEALRVAPGLASAEIREIRVGLRPYTTTDGLPLLGAAPQVRNIYLATGHGAYGLHLGPYSGKLIADRMLGRTPEADLSIFDPRRFAA